MRFDEDKFDKAKVFLIIVAVAYSIIIIRLLYLQVFMGSHYLKLSESNRVKMKRIEAPRGKIYDRKGRLIATNRAGYRLVYLKGKKFTPEILDGIGRLIDETPKKVEKRIMKGEIYKYTGENILVDDMTEERAHRIMERLDEFPYLDVVYYPKRKYLYEIGVSNAVGYVKTITKDEYDKLKDEGYDQKDVVGKRGIEKFYDKILQGEAGYEYIEVNAMNKAIKTIKEKEVVPGKDIYLSIDLELQIYMMEQMRDKQGAFVAIDTRDGSVITFVSAPEYNINSFSSKMSQEEWSKVLNDKRRPLQNRASVGTYPPGSIFKVIPSMAFLEKGINPKEQIYDPGFFKLGKWRWNDWELAGHGKVDLERAIEDSCDTYFYTMSNRIGYSKIVEVAKKYGLGDITGVDLGEEKKGIVPDPEWKKTKKKENWYAGDTINLSIGQGYMLTTPLQMAQLYVVFANEGFAYTPHLQYKMVSADGKEEIFKPEVRTNIKGNPEYFKVIKNGLRRVVTKGTATPLNIADILIAGKTGSAENAQYKVTHGWFSGYAPADKPEIAVTAFVEGGGHGGSVAVPLAKAFFQKYFEIKNRKEVEVTAVQPYRTGYIAKKAVTTAAAVETAATGQAIVPAEVKPQETQDITINDVSVETER